VLSVKRSKVQFDTLNGGKFSGSITPIEAKFIIYKDSLEFGGFSNFNDLDTRGAQ
jgi:hypothetical protein